MSNLTRIGTSLQFEPQDSSPITSGGEKGQLYYDNARDAWIFHDGFAEVTFAKVANSSVPFPVAGYKARVIEDLKPEIGDPDSTIDPNTTGTWNGDSYNLLCDNTKVVTTTGLNYSLNIAPNFVLKPWDVLVIEEEVYFVYPITLTTGVLDRIPPPQIAAPVVCAQALVTKDLCAHGPIGQRLRDAFPSREISRANINIQASADDDETPDYAIGLARAYLSVSPKGPTTNIVNDALEIESELPLTYRYAWSSFTMPQAASITSVSMLIGKVGSPTSAISVALLRDFNGRPQFEGTSNPGVIRTTSGGLNNEVSFGGGSQLERGIGFTATSFGLLTGFEVVLTAAAGTSGRVYAGLYYADYAGGPPVGNPIEEKYVEASVLPLSGSGATRATTIPFQGETTLHAGGHYVVVLRAETTSMQVYLKYTTGLNADNTAWSAYRSSSTSFNWLTETHDIPSTAFGHILTHTPVDVTKAINSSTLTTSKELQIFEFLRPVEVSEGEKVWIQLRCLGGLHGLTDYLIINALNNGGVDLSDNPIFATNGQAIQLAMNLTGASEGNPNFRLSDSYKYAYDQISGLDYAEDVVFARPGRSFSMCIIPHPAYNSIYINGYDVSFIDADAQKGKGGLSYHAYGTSDNSGPSINCRIVSGSGVTDIFLDWVIPDPFNNIQQLRVYIDGKELSYNASPIMSYIITGPQSVQINSDLSGSPYSVDVRYLVGSPDMGESNNQRISALYDKIISTNPQGVLDPMFVYSNSPNLRTYLLKNPYNDTIVINDPGSVLVGSRQRSLGTLTINANNCIIEKVHVDGDLIVMGSNNYLSEVNCSLLYFAPSSTKNIVENSWANRVLDQGTDNLFSVISPNG